MEKTISELLEILQQRVYDDCDEVNIADFSEYDKIMEKAEGIEQMSETNEELLEKVALLELEIKDLKEEYGE